MKSLLITKMRMVERHLFTIGKLYFTVEIYHKITHINRTSWWRPAKHHRNQNGHWNR